MWTSRGLSSRCSSETSMRTQSVRWKERHCPDDVWKNKRLLWKSTDPYFVNEMSGFIIRTCHYLDWLMILGRYRKRVTVLSLSQSPETQQIRRTNDTTGIWGLCAHSWSAQECWEANNTFDIGYGITQLTPASQGERRRCRESIPLIRSFSGRIQSSALVSPKQDIHDEQVKRRLAMRVKMEENKCQTTTEIPKTKFYESQQAIGSEQITNQKLVLITLHLLIGWNHRTVWIF